MNTRPSSQAGFTLIEAIIVIVITGAIAAMVAVFIAGPINGYTISVRHAQLTDAADATLNRMQRDIRLALPNSVRVTDSSGSADTCSAATCYIEFIPTSSGALYRAAGDGSTGGNILDFTNAAATTFDVLGLMPTLATGANGDYIVVYNLGPNFNPANAYLLKTGQCATATEGCNIAQVSAVSGNTVTLASNPFANETPPLPSPNNRFQAVPNAGPVTYSCSSSAGASINRYTGYGFLQTQPNTTTALTAATSVGLVVANATCQVDYQPTVLLRDGILYVRINVTDAASGDSVSVFREIHVDNAP
jgi:MSHA biogenesis protein MshO